MKSFDDALDHKLAAIREQGLYRQLRPVNSAQATTIELDGKPHLNFSSNDYLGLANEPVLKEAAIRAVEKFGSGSGASRLICGSLAPHHELEDTLSHFKSYQAALSFSSRFDDALGCLCALAGKGDFVILDKLVHASIVDAARLSGATLRIFAHNDLNDLEAKLQWARKSVAAGKNILVVTESVFSMDGDTAPLRDMVELKNRHGAWLMVDEAHATGLFGERRRGLIEELQVSEQVEVQMGTLGKAVGASGGYICGSRKLVDWLVNRARSFIFSTAPVPAAAAAATAGIRFIQTEAGARRRIQGWENIERLHAALKKMNCCGESPQSLILPVILGEESRAMELSKCLRERGIFVPAIRYPTVARGAARLRITVTAMHTARQIDQLADSMSTLHPSSCP